MACRKRDIGLALGWIVQSLKELRQTDVDLTEHLSTNLDKIRAAKPSRRRLARRSSVLTQSGSSVMWDAMYEETSGNPLSEYGGRGLPDEYVSEDNISARKSEDTASLHPWQQDWRTQSLCRRSKRRKPQATPRAIDRVKQDAEELHNAPPAPAKPSLQRSASACTSVSPLAGSHKPTNQVTDSQLTLNQVTGSQLTINQATGSQLTLCNSPPMTESPILSRCSSRRTIPSQTSRDEAVATKPEVPVLCTPGTLPIVTSFDEAAKNLQRSSTESLLDVTFEKQVKLEKRSSWKFESIKSARVKRQKAAITSEGDEVFQFGPSSKMVIHTRDGAPVLRTEPEESVTASIDLPSVPPTLKLPELPGTVPGHPSPRISPYHTPGSSPRPRPQLKSSSLEDVLNASDAPRRAVSMDALKQHGTGADLPVPAARATALQLQQKAVAQSLTHLKSTAYTPGENTSRANRPDLTYPAYVRSIGRKTSAIRSGFHDPPAVHSGSSLAAAHHHSSVLEPPAAGVLSDSSNSGFHVSCPGGLPAHSSTVRSNSLRLSSGLASQGTIPSPGSHRKTSSPAVGESTSRFPSTDSVNVYRPRCSIGASPNDRMTLVPPTPEHSPPSMTSGPVLGAVVPGHLASTVVAPGHHASTVVAPGHHSYTGMLPTHCASTEEEGQEAKDMQLTSTLSLPVSLSPRSTQTVHPCSTHTTLSRRTLSVGMATHSNADVPVSPGGTVKDKSSQRSLDTPQKFPVSPRHVNESSSEAIIRRTPFRGQRSSLTSSPLLRQKWHRRTAFGVPDARYLVNSCNDLPVCQLEGDGGESSTCSDSDARFASFSADWSMAARTVEDRRWRQSASDLEGGHSRNLTCQPGTSHPSKLPYSHSMRNLQETPRRHVPPPPPKRTISLTTAATAAADGGGEMVARMPAKKGSRKSKGKAVPQEPIAEAGAVTAGYGYGTLPSFSRKRNSITYSSARASMSRKGASLMSRLSAPLLRKRSSGNITKEPDHSLNSIDQGASSDANDYLDDSGQFDIQEFAEGKMAVSHV
eukprot:scpid16464/ scgid5808/ 